ncbi:MFS transporter [Fervidobacterium nodosum]|uniref:Major facilitator superfamily MFS_1 n=1 Tax=Fervidobacterium nodosum (strain ATCC 35602 / DSM 5306 / Rt17-B1) TaxID=381764 RepID=A7HKR6_FERNB|nr:MFS transporter [Fervidobacterium nodosum]ABS60499.1 major facilitator superfamily MFS_1 [Fervidobacterium nodosum Rt17-B1]PHJ14450.1 MFS transporter [Fervidobacterium sp. SC_NGM5_G05]
MLFYINLYTFLVGISKAAYTALFNLYLKSLSYENSIIGNSTFYYSWGLAFGGLLFSSISDRIGRKKTLLVTMPLFSLAGLLRLIPTSYTLLYVFSFLFGFFDTSIILPTISVIESSDEKKRLRNSNMNFAIVMLTGVLGYFGAGLLSEKIGLVNSLRLSMILALFSILPLFALPNTKLRVKRKKLKTNGKMYLNPVQLTMLFYYILSGALVSAAAAVFINFGNVIFLDLFLFSTTTITLILTISQLSTAVTSLFTHKLTSKYGYKLLLFVLYLSVTLLIFMMPIFMLNSALFTVAYILRYILLNITTPMFMVFCLSYLPKSYLATFSGVSYFINNLMKAFSAQIFTHLSKSGTTNYSKLFLITGTFYLLNTIITLITFVLIYIFKDKTDEKTQTTKLEQSKKNAFVTSIKDFKHRRIISYQKDNSQKLSVHIHNSTTFKKNKDEK